MIQIIPFLWLKAILFCFAKSFFAQRSTNLHYFFHNFFSKIALKFYLPTKFCSNSCRHFNTFIFPHVQLFWIKWEVGKKNMVLGGFWVNLWAKGILELRGKAKRLWVREENHTFDFMNWKISILLQPMNASPYSPSRHRNAFDQQSKAWCEERLRSQI